MLHMGITTGSWRTNSVRKELKIRPGYTPQEDVGRFKTSRKQIAEMNALPKGHIVGWVPPSSSSQSKSQAGSSGGGSGGNGGGVKVPTTDANGQPLSKAALKNAKRKAKKIAEKANTATASGGGSTSVSRAEDSDEEGGGPVVVDVDDAPDTWDDEREEETPADGTLSLGGDTSAKESQICENPGVDAVANGLEKLAVSE